MATVERSGHVVTGERFSDEGAVAARLRHPGRRRVLDRAASTGVDHGRACAMSRLQLK
ncbi:hypothetical protein [Streptomyces sp. NPDC001068]|uniref:hypothetical protein n=1 Tax=Streptomyces sp. NPDC001068 TaxID=3364544 RepID=UPI0036CAAFD7